MDQQIAQLEADLLDYDTYRLSPEYTSLTWEEQNELDGHWTCKWVLLQELKDERDWLDNRFNYNLDDCYPDPWADDYAAIARGEY